MGRQRTALAGVAAIIALVLCVVLFSGFDASQPMPPAPRGGGASGNRDAIINELVQLHRERNERRQRARNRLNRLQPVLPAGGAGHAGEPDVHNPGGGDGGGADHQQGDVPRGVESMEAMDRGLLIPPNNDDVNGTIFVSLASYRDPECRMTVRDMFERARRPALLFVGAVEQHLSEDPNCVPPAFRDDPCATGVPVMKSTLPDSGLMPLPPGYSVGIPVVEYPRRRGSCPVLQIRRALMEPRKAKGPTYARYVATQLYRGERYFMMMDSHNRFVTGWDSILTRIFRNMGRSRVVLSHYPEAWHHPSAKEKNPPLDGRRTTTYMCNAKFVAHLGYPRLDGIVISRSIKPRPQPWAAAGFLFALGDVLREVPFDPNLDFTFDGEEILYSARLWTHGYDIFSPSENTIYHYYYRTGAKRFFEVNPPGRQTASDAARIRIQYMMKVYRHGTGNLLVPTAEKAGRLALRDLDKYGMGDLRTLEEWYSYGGIDRRHQKLTRNFCKEFNTY